MTLEGTDVEPNLPRAVVQLVLKNTTKSEVMRIFDALQVMVEQGVFNTRRAGLVLNFNDKGKLNSIHIEGTKWHAGRENPMRVAMYEKAIVMIASDTV